MTCQTQHAVVPQPKIWVLSAIVYYKENAIVMQTALVMLKSVRIM
jgi:hypothetical protein